MEQAGTTVQGRFKGGGLEQITLDDVNLQAIKIASIAGRADQSAHREAAPDQLAHNRRADETGGAGHENHGRFLNDL